MQYTFTALMALVRFLYEGVDITTDGYKAVIASALVLTYEPGADTALHLSYEGRVETIKGSSWETITHTLCRYRDVLDSRVAEGLILTDYSEQAELLDDPKVVQELLLGRTTSWQEAEWEYGGSPEPSVDRLVTSPAAAAGVVRSAIRGAVEDVRTVASLVRTQYLDAQFFLGSLIELSLEDAISEAVDGMCPGAKRLLEFAEADMARTQLSQEERDTIRHEEFVARQDAKYAIERERQETAYDLDPINDKEYMPENTGMLRKAFKVPPVFTKVEFPTSRDVAVLFGYIKHPGHYDHFVAARVNERLGLVRKELMAMTPALSKKTLVDDEAPGGITVPWAWFDPDGKVTSDPIKDGLAQFVPYGGLIGHQVRGRYAVRSFKDVVSASHYDWGFEAPSTLDRFDEVACEGTLTNPLTGTAREDCELTHRKVWLDQSFEAAYSQVRSLRNAVDSLLDPSYRPSQVIKGDTHTYYRVGPWVLSMVSAEDTMIGMLPLASQFGETALSAFSYLLQAGWTVQASHLGERNTPKGPRPYALVDLQCPQIVGSDGLSVRKPYLMNKEGWAQLRSSILGGWFYNLQLSDVAPFRPEEVAEEVARRNQSNFDNPLLFQWREDRQKMGPIPAVVLDFHQDPDGKPIGITGVSFIAPIVGNNKLAIEVPAGHTVHLEADLREKPLSQQAETRAKQLVRDMKETYSCCLLFHKGSTKAQKQDVLASFASLWKPKKRRHV